MRPRPLITAGILAFAVLFIAAQADAKGRATKGKKRRGKVFNGHGVDRELLRESPVPRPSGDIWVYSVNFREEVRVNIYRKNSPAQATAAIVAAASPLVASVDSKVQDGAATAEPVEYDEEALAELDHVFRCKRTGEVRAVDPRLYETLSVISDHFGGKRIDLISGFRFQRQEGSRHFHASAMDIRIISPVSRLTDPVSSAMTTSPCSTMRTTSSWGGGMKPGPSIASS